MAKISGISAFFDNNTERFGKISFTMLVLYFLDIILLGTGVITKVGMFSTRILFFGLSILFSLPLLLKNLKTPIRQPYVICVAAFMLWVAISAVRGVLNSNRMDIIKTDVFGYLNFCIVPTMLCVVNSRRRVKCLSITIIGSCLIMAVISVVLSFFPFFPNKYEFYPILNRTGIAAITVMNGSATRVFCHTASRVFLVAYVLLVTRLLHEEDKKRTLWGIAALSLLIVAIFLSYSRSPYAGCALGVVAFIAVFVILNHQKLKKAICLVLASAVVAAAMIGTLGLVQKENLFQPAIFRVLLSINYTGEEAPSNSDVTTDPVDPEPSEPSYDTQEAEENNLLNRQDKINLLNQSIAKNPVFGNGLGAAIDYDGGYVEYTFHDILNKMGIVGLLLFLMPFVLHIYYIFKRLRFAGDTQEILVAAAMFAAMVYFLFITYFNPCMNTTVGISCYGLSMVAMHRAIGSAEPETNT